MHMMGSLYWEDGREKNILHGAEENWKGLRYGVYVLISQWEIELLCIFD